MSKIKVIFIPGNGGGSTEYEWFPWVKTELEKLGCEVVSPGTYPDPIVARMSVWLPFIESFGTDENTILVGWSSGAEAAMRYAETHQVLGTVLVAPCHTDLELQSEKESGYYDAPWQWEKIKTNQKWIIQFSSINDPFIPIDEARFVHEQLESVYHEMDKGHFFPMNEFPKLVEAVERYI